MEFAESLKDPLSAAVFAAFVVALYIHIKARMNNEGKIKTSDYVKPALLVAMLVYFIVQTGMASRETIMSEPY
jgi:hypothetical protein